MTDDVCSRSQDLKKHFPVREGCSAASVGSVQAVDGVVLRRSAAARRSAWSASPAAASRRSAGASCACSSRRPARSAFDGVDVRRARRARAAAMRREMQIVFQDSVRLARPAHDASATSIAEPLAIHGSPARSAASERVASCSTRVGLAPEHADRYPHEFSRRPAPAHRHRPRARARARAHGRRRAGLGARRVDPGAGRSTCSTTCKQRARPDLPLRRARPRGRRHISDRVAVMYLGQDRRARAGRRALTRGRCTRTRRRCCRRSRCPTRRRKRQRIVLTGDVPSPINPPSGCRFRTRCPIAQPSAPRRSRCSRPRPGPPRRPATSPARPIPEPFRHSHGD